MYTFTPPLCGYCFPARGYLCYTDINVQVGPCGLHLSFSGSGIRFAGGCFQGLREGFHNLRTEASGSGSAGSAAEKFWITFGEGYLPATADVEPVVWPGINRSSRRRSYEMLCKNSILRCCLPRGGHQTGASPVSVNTALDGFPEGERVERCR